MGLTSVDQEDEESYSLEEHGEERGALTRMRC